MKLVNHPILFITPLFILGIVLGFQFLVPLKYTLGLLWLILFLFFTNYYYSKSKLFFSPFHTLLVGFTMLTIGFTIAQLQRVENKKQHYIHQNLKEELLIEGVITDKLKPNRYYFNYLLDVKTLQKKPTEGKVLLSIKKDSTQKGLAIGSSIILKEKLNDVFAPLNPHQFNYQLYLKKQQVFKQVSTEINEVNISENEGFYFKKTAEKFRRQILESLHQSGFTKNQINLTAALLLGQRKELSKDIYHDFTAAGVVHILAVSGLHVGILLIILNVLFTPLKKLKAGKWIAYGLSVICIWAFALIVGCSPSVIRAALMFSFLNAGLIFNRKGSTFNMLCLSALVMLIYDAYLIFSVGFQMSYLAVLGIISFQPLLKNKFYIKNWLGRKSIDLILVSFCAQLGVLPLSIFYFHQFPAMFLIANLLILSWLFILLSLGIIAIIASSLQLEIPLIYEGYAMCLDLLLWIIHKIASMDGLLLENIFFTKKMMLSLYLFILLVFLVIKYYKKTFIYAVLLSMLNFQFFFIYEFYRIYKIDKFYILHQNRKTLLAEKENYQLNIYCNDSLHGYSLNTIDNFKTELAIKQAKQFPIKNIYAITENKKLLVIDSLGIYKLPKNVKVNYILLSNSPKINLEHVIEELNPDQVIADGNNYRSYVQRWRKTCVKKKLPLHYTGEKGAFIIDR
ncbi:ComEC/Rec2 family competence protein [Mesonia aestuariivivens]|uniref:ComEC family competence protein n=1 Tax=Mesonia aestuariivivens TaxID=2796128 RepID=A0ABS6VXY1_9FLAO|nr:ComEC/Rec2 family competence protein [Mesonia aestuariivivens]MBW2960440.1 ComEC family competence protein [Mesonia aestuariivivens]